MTALRPLREKAGLTQVQVANSLDVAQSTVATWEGDSDAYPRGSLIPALAALLGCTIDDLFNAQTPSS